MPEKRIYFVKNVKFICKIGTAELNLISCVKADMHYTKKNLIRCLHVEDAFLTAGVVSLHHLITFDAYFCF